MDQKEGASNKVLCTLPWVASPNLQDPVPALFQSFTQRCESVAKAKAAAAAATPVLIRDHKMKWLDFGTTSDEGGLSPHPGFVWMQAGYSQSIPWRKMRPTKQTEGGPHNQGSLGNASEYGVGTREAGCRNGKSCKNMCPTISMVMSAQMGSRPCLRKTTQTTMQNKTV